MQKLLFEDTINESVRKEVGTEPAKQKLDRPNRQKRQLRLGGQTEMLNVLGTTKCKLCGNEFKTWGKKQFCSPKCHHRYKNWSKHNTLHLHNPITGDKAQQVGICVVCNKTFTIGKKATKAWLCSEECRRTQGNKSNNQWAKRYYGSTPERYFTKRWNDIKREVRLGKRRGIMEFSLNKADLLNKWIKQNGKCAVSGMQMTHDTGQGTKMTNASVDRIDNKTGYTDGNTRLVCWMANVMRHKMDDAELLKWCKAIVKTLE